jgi:uncharacterized membrane protein
MHSPSERDLTAALLGLWPKAVAYVLSFAAIGIMWQNHHAVFRKVEHIDRRTVFINLLLLAATVFVPFATYTLGTYPSMHASTFLYGLVLTTTSILYNILLWHLIASHSFNEEVTPDVIKPTVVAYRFGLVGYCFAMLLAAYYLIPRGLDSDLRE